jgi:Fur family peroxide stress response transcriptional regulator
LLSSFERLVARLEKANLIHCSLESFSLRFLSMKGASTRRDASDVDVGSTSRATLLLAELKRAGLKLTPQRIAIVRALADDHSHPTAQELYDRLHDGFPTMSFATVYNTLDALANCGLTGSLNLGSTRAVRFDPNTSPHHHAVCDACGAIVDLPAEPPSAEAAHRVLAGAPGFRVRSEERIFRGLCGRCSSPKGEEP